MKFKSFITTLLMCFAFLSISCSDKNINTSRAYSTIDSYLAEKPIYESTIIDIGKTRLKKTKDHELIEFYKKLENEGYVAFEEQSSKKRWLSKDSVWTVTLKLTEKSHPFVIDQRSNRVRLKTIEYRLNKNNNVQIDNKGKKTATATVLLNKEHTPFSFLHKDKSPNSEFITKKFKLRYSEEIGWTVMN